MFLTWVINGILAILWLLIENGLSLILLVVLLYATHSAPQTHRLWLANSSVIALLVTFFAPFPFTLMALGMALAGIFAVRLDKFSPDDTHWTMVRGLALYTLIGLGVAMYAALQGSITDPMLLQGQVYLNTIIGLAMYLFPLGYLALLAQSVLAHPPTNGNPEEIIFRYRSRGQQ